jgi:hypothetical protein
MNRRTKPCAIIQPFMFGNQTYPKPQAATATPVSSEAGEILERAGLRPDGWSAADAEQKQQHEQEFAADAELASFLQAEIEVQRHVDLSTSSHEQPSLLNALLTDMTTQAEFTLVDSDDEEEGKDASEVPPDYFINRDETAEQGAKADAIANARLASIEAADGKEVCVLLFPASRRF